MSGYLHIKAWCAYTGNHVKGQIAQAVTDKAPNNAIYYSDDDKRWITACEIQDEDVRRHIDRLAEMYLNHYQ